MQTFPGEIQQDRSTENPATRIHSHHHSEVRWGQLTFCLPFSKNSDLRFKFFKDMDSESTWGVENRIPWGTGEKAGSLIVLIHERRTQCASLKMYHIIICCFVTSHRYITQQMALILSTTVQRVQSCLESSAPPSGSFCTRYTDIGLDQFRDLSDCVLSLFTFVPHGQRLLATTSINPIWGHVLQRHGRYLSSV